MEAKSNDNMLITSQTSNKLSMHYFWEYFTLFNQTTFLQDPNSNQINLYSVKHLNTINMHSTVIIASNALASVLSRKA